MNTLADKPDPNADKRARQQEKKEALLDETIEDSFPASDPPARTPIVRSGPPEQDGDSDQNPS